MSGRRKTARERPGFEDIRSSSTGVQEKPQWFSEARPSAAEAAGRRQEERRAQRADPRGRKKGKAQKARGSRNKKGSKGAQERKRPAEQNRSGERPRSNERPQPKERSRSNERRRRKPMSLFKRRVLIVLTLLAMLLGTGFLAESLLLRVTSVEVAGDQVYDEADILRICGFKTGDNLLLIPASDREQRLEKELPYIAKAKISRRIPGTVKIEITAAKGICCIQSGPEWYVVAAGGKVLEAGAAPKEGLMQVLGVTPKSAKPGEIMEFEGEQEATKVFLELLDTMDQLGEEGQNPQGEFTKMDLSDLYNIRLWYQDRVECRLGSAGQLEYKLRYGYGNLTNTEKGIGPGETGVLDLSYLPTKKASYFTPSDGSVQPTPNPDGTIPAAPKGGSGTPAASPTPGRGGDIPESPFTGKSSTGGDTGSSNGGDTGGDNGDDTGGYTGEDTGDDTGGEDYTGDDTGEDTGGDGGDTGEGGE